MESGALIHKHTVVAERNADNVIASGGDEKRGEVFDVILVGLHMVRITCVAAHRHSRQLAHEMIFKAGADDLLRIIEVLGADKADDRAYKERLITLGKTVAARLRRNVIPAVVSVG